jgi:xanthine dehydrogenase iron-sulfur cluster and FAD-binding subunit A
MSAVACVAAKYAVPMRTFSNKYMSRNFCRCGAYPHIVAAAAIANAAFHATGKRDRDLPIIMKKLMPIFGISLRVTWRRHAE